MKIKNTFLLLILAAVIISCDSNGVSNKEIKKLDNAIEKWESKKAQDYSYEFERGCFCPYFGKVEIVVFADTVYAVKDPETGEDVTIETESGSVKILEFYPDYFPTMDELFETLKEASLKADEMKGSYDSEIGYPKEVSIDYYEDAIDDEVTYQTGNYQILTLQKRKN